MSRMPDVGELRELLRRARRGMHWTVAQVDHWMNHTLLVHHRRGYSMRDDLWLEYAMLRGEALDREAE